MSQTHQKYLKRISDLRKKGDKLVEIWECEFSNLAKTDELMKKIFKR